jgi:hypothetical protein
MRVLHDPIRIKEVAPVAHHHVPLGDTAAIVDMVAELEWLLAQEAVAGRGRSPVVVRIALRPLAIHAERNAEAPGGDHLRIDRFLCLDEHPTATERGLVIDAENGETAKRWAVANLNGHNHKRLQF